MPRRYHPMLSLLCGLLMLYGCSPGASAPKGDQLETAGAATLESIASPTLFPPTMTPTLPAPETTLWMTYDEGGDQIWVLGDGLPYQRTLPVSIGGFYGYTATTNRILMAAQWGDHGAGPGNVSVSDLSILDLNTGQVSTLISDNVVEAQWAPGGDAIAYILATSETYELHWRTSDGADRVFAHDVTFTWSISPTGGAVAFTRETGYELDMAPGFYIVQVATGEEMKLSDVDKSGTGSTADFPYWSFDGNQVILSHYGGPPPARVVWARVDGSEVHDLGLLTETGEIQWDLTLPFLLWDPDGEHLYTNPDAFYGEGEMGGASPLIRYRLERTNYTLVEPETMGTFWQIIDWAVPGYSLWVQDESGVHEYILP
jgi:hypothetical protein